MELEQKANQILFDQQKVYRQRFVVGNQITRQMRKYDVSRKGLVGALFKRWKINETTAGGYINNFINGKYNSTPCRCPRDPNARIYSKKDSRQLRDIFHYLTKVGNSRK